jgi:hypothetical protein
MRCHTADHHRVGRRQAFQARGNVDRVSGGQVLMSPPTAHFPHDHGSGVEADAHCQLHAFLVVQVRIQAAGDGVDDAQAAMQGTLGVIFVRFGPAKIDEQSITQIGVDVQSVLKVTILSSFKINNL